MAAGRGGGQAGAGPGRGGARLGGHAPLQPGQDGACARPSPGGWGGARPSRGMLVTPATVLFVVGDLDRVIVDVPLTEKMLGAACAPGSRSACAARRWATQPVAATLSRVSPFLAAGQLQHHRRDRRRQPRRAACCPACSSPPTSPPARASRPRWCRPARCGKTRAPAWSGSTSSDRRGERQAAARQAPGHTSGPHPVRAAPGGDPGRGTRHGGRGRRRAGRLGGHPGPAPAGRRADRRGAGRRASRAGRRGCAWRPGTGCWSCSRGSRRICWPRFLEKQQRLARALGAAPPPTSPVTARPHRGRVRADGGR